MKRIEKLIQSSTDVNWMIKLRQLDFELKMEFIDARCPSCAERCMRTYFPLSDDELQQELMTINELLDQELEHINFDQLKDLLP